MTLNSIPHHQPTTFQSFIKITTVFNVQSKPVYSNYLFASKNGMKEPIIKNQMKINTKCEFLTHQEK